jgi:hypothetical protein
MERRAGHQEEMERISKNNIVCRLTPNYAESRTCLPISFAPFTLFWMTSEVLFIRTHHFLSTSGRYHLNEANHIPSFLKRNSIFASCTFVLESLFACSH